jgi:two-component system response regulator AtoC
MLAPDSRSVLLVEADADARRDLDQALRGLGYEAVAAGSVDDALAALARDAFAFSLIDATVDGRDGLDVLRGLRRRGGSPGAVILIAGEDDLGRVSEAAALGADDFLPRRFRPDDLENVLKEAGARPRRAWGPPPEEPGDPAAQLRREIALCQSPRMREVWEIARRAAAVDVTVLVGGETGTGKDLVARAVHHYSSRAGGPYVKVNCAAVPRELLESELFGHERGAFTGAHQLKTGKFELAHRGTIFLDEIGDLHPALQAKLLHVLQDGTFSRVGGRATLRVDVRVLAATNRQLEREVAEGRFREDLYYRLNVIQIVVPPLRERMEELPALAGYFAERYTRLFRRDGFALSRAGIERLARHRYPGNVRELENLVKRMIVLDDPDLVRTPLLRVAPPPPAAAPPGVAELALSPNGHGEEAGPAPAPAAPEVPSLRDIGRQAARDAEREAIARVLQQTGWNRVRAARVLRISYRALLYKIKDVGLDRAVEPAP